MYLASAATAGARAIFLSRFSGLDMVTFKPLVQEMLKDGPELSQARLLYLPSASYCLSETSDKGPGEQRRRFRYEAKQKSQLIASSLGMAEEQTRILELDRPGAATPEEVRKALRNADVLYVEGGNTFYLQFLLLQSNFWSSALPLMQNKKLLYMGASAGAIVAGATVETAFWKGWDSPHPAKMGIDADVWHWNAERLTGMGLLGDISFFPHYQQQNHQALVREKAAGKRVICIPDDVAVAVGLQDVPIAMAADGTRRECDICSIDSSSPPLPIGKLTARL